MMITKMMKTENLGTYQGNLVYIMKISTYWNEAVVYYVNPVGKQQANAFKIGLPFLKKT